MPPPPPLLPKKRRGSNAGAGAAGSAEGGEADGEGAVGEAEPLRDAAEQRALLTTAAKERVVAETRAMVPKP
jgi:hypothetical protein